jgi:hypothetical protein
MREGSQRSQMTVDPRTRYDQFVFRTAVQRELKFNTLVFLRHLRRKQKSGSGRKPKKLYYLHEVMKVLIPHTKLRCQSETFRESQRSEVEHEISDKDSAEESQWLTSYLNAVILKVIQRLTLSTQQSTLKSKLHQTKS